MSVFNGEFRRGRVVNLGGSNASVSKNSILQKAQNQREKRKLLKRQENASRVLQKHIRSYLDLTHQRKMFSDNWLSSTSTNSLNQVVSQFSFMFQYSVKHNEPQNNLEKLQKLSSILDNTVVINGLTLSNVRKLFNSISASFPVFYKEALITNPNEIHFKLIMQILTILNNISTFQSLEKVTNIQTKLIFTVLAKEFDVFANSNQDLLNLSVRVLCGYRLLDLPLTLKFLTNSYIIEYLKLCNLSEDITTPNSHGYLILQCFESILKNIDSPSLNYLKDNTSLEKLQILANTTSVLQILIEDIGESNVSVQTLQTYVNGLADILTVTNCSVVENDEEEVVDDDNGDSSDEKNVAEPSVGEHEAEVVTVKLSKSNIWKYDFLYSKTFLYLIFNLIGQGFISPIKLSSLYSSLLKLKAKSDKQTSNLFVYLYMMPGGLSSFRELIFNSAKSNYSDKYDDVIRSSDYFNELNTLNLHNNNEIFNYISNQQESHAIKGNNTEFLQKLLPSLYSGKELLSVKEILNEKFFIKDLFIFLEVLSYWLIILTDADIINLPESESKQTDDAKYFLTKNQFISFIRFLKRFCLLLVWNNIEITKLFLDAKSNAFKKESEETNNISIFGFGDNNFGNIKSTVDQNRSVFGSNSSSAFGSSGSAFGPSGSAFGALGSTFDSAFGDNNSNSSNTNGTDNFGSANFSEVDCVEDLSIDDSNVGLFHVKPSYHDFSLLKSLSIKVLNQINLIDSRLNFLPKGFWLVRDKKLEDVDILLPVIAEEEERKIASQWDSDNESEDDIYGNVNGGDFNDSYYRGESSGINSFARQQNTSKKSNKSKLLLKDQNVEGLLSVFRLLPFFMSFNNRVRIFQMLISLDRARGDYDREDFNAFNFLTGQPQLNRNTAEVRRDHLLEDSFNAFNKLTRNFKARLQVTFIDQYGKPEAGIDGGGITKEFLTSVVNDGFNNPASGLFRQNQNFQLYPNPDIYLNLKHNPAVYGNKDVKQAEYKKLQKLQFLGKVIGKCLYEGILVDVNFVPSFLKKFKTIGKVSTFDELADVDPELYVGLSKLLKLDDSFFKLSEMNFTLTEKLTYTIPEKSTVNVYTGEEETELAQTRSKLITIDLIPNGSNIAVTNANKLNYINAIANFKLNKSLFPQIDSFLKGLFQIIPSEWLNMFNPAELQMLVSGGEKDIDIDDFKANVEYGGFLENDPTVVYFWECVAEMKPEERFKLVKFVTSVPRAPLLGFGDLNPRFGIRNAGYSTEWLPTASTCVNLLKLPDYRDKQILKEKLLYVINSEAGFDLS